MNKGTSTTRISWRRPNPTEISSKSPFGASTGGKETKDDANESKTLATSFETLEMDLERRGRTGNEYLRIRRGR